MAITASTKYKLCVVIPNGNGAKRVVACGSKKLMTAQAKKARVTNPHLTYEVMDAPGKLLGDLIEPPTA